VVCINGKLQEEHILGELIKKIKVVSKQESNHKSKEVISGKAENE